MLKTGETSPVKSPGDVTSPIFNGSVPRPEDGLPDAHMKLWEKGATLNLGQTWTKIVLTCDLRFHWTSFIGNSETTDFWQKVRELSVIVSMQAYKPSIAK